MSDAAQSGQGQPDTIGGYELAEKLTGLSRGTLYSLVHERRIPHMRLSRRLVRFRADELQAWLDAHAVTAGEHTP